jgi:outer membrane lipase/esterase
MYRGDAMTIIRRLVFRVILVALFASPLPAAAGPFSAVYVIGDSLSDQGNLFGATNLLAGPANALPASDHYFNGRFSNGPVYADLVAQALGLPLTPSLTGGNNFAYGGARTTYNRVDQVPLGGPFPNGLFPWSLNAEVQAFNARNVHDPNALYIVFSGSNDVADILSPGMNPAIVIPTAVAGIVSAVQAFANAGAKTVLVPNIPDLGLTPAFRSLGPPPVNPASFLSAQFNQALGAALTALDAALDLRIIQFQTDDLVNDLVKDPVSFGLSPSFNVTTPCYSGFVAPNPAGIECTKPDEFLFWDIVHPTAVVHRLLADAIVAEVPEPSTIPLFVASLLAFGVLFRKSSISIRSS